MVNKAHNKYPPIGDIVIFQPEFIEFGGEERVILTLSRELHSQGKSHSILCYNDIINLSSFANWPVKVYQLRPKNTPINRVFALRRALKYINNTSPTPVLFNIQSAYHAGIFSNSTYNLRIPDTYSLLGYDNNKFQTNNIWEKLKIYLRSRVCHIATRRGIKQSKAFVTNTKALQIEMQNLYKRKAEVIYLGGFGGPGNTVPQRTNSPIELLSVSRLQKSKRIEWILYSLAEIENEKNIYPNWHLNIVGTGPDEESIRSLCDSLCLNDMVTFHGFVSDTVLDGLYKKSHLFLMPAKQGYGLPAIEALDKRLGLVVSEGSGVIELLENTNWVSIARGGEIGFTTAMKEMLIRVNNPIFFAQPLPSLPTEETWAKNIIDFFEW